MTTALPFTDELQSALRADPARAGRLSVTGDGDLPSVYRVTDLAVAVVGVAGLAVAELAGVLGAGSGSAGSGSAVAMDAAPPATTVDRALASSWFGSAVTPIDWPQPSVWDPLTRNYRSRDGQWIRLHANVARHQTAALGVLGLAENPDHVDARRAVARWDAEALETAIVQAGGCAAVMRTRGEWARHPQGSAVAAEPLLGWATGQPGTVGAAFAGTRQRPLAGLRVLDLTRVIAGPVATRFLAGYGADVLRIDPPDWNEDALLANMILGKRAARIDATTPDGAARLRDLVAGADVLVHGYRDGALDALGLDAAARRELRPGLIDVSLTAYGSTGPWSGRRGFDSLVQMSDGIAARGMAWATAETPTPLPVQALDHATGYLLAAAAVRGVIQSLTENRGSAVRTSLARVGELLVAGGEQADGGALIDRCEPTEPLETPWGGARMLRPPLDIDGAPMAFDRGPRALGADDATW
ncbi:CoA transferase [Marisediminicola senii]|uniref:CoA transferase n=1 Tax=Marisediminicola senii TaxID=2711233 RepID=UPI001911CE7C|nr:CoA transferase [Marisediminicola senii]